MPALQAGAFGSVTRTALVNILLPLVHPRIGSPLTGAGSVALIEPPGLLMLDCGLQTPFINLVGHIASGAIVVGFGGLAG